MAAEMKEIVIDEIRPTAVLCGVDTGEFDMDRAMDELESLAETAGAEVVVKNNTTNIISLIFSILLCS